MVAVLHTTQIALNEDLHIWIQISLNFVPKWPTEEEKSTLAAWFRPQAVTWTKDYTFSGACKRHWVSSSEDIFGRMPEARSSSGNCWKFINSTLTSALTTDLGIKFIKPWWLSMHFLRPEQNCQAEVYNLQRFAVEVKITILVRTSGWRPYELLVRYHYIHIITIRYCHFYYNI